MRPCERLAALGCERSGVDLGRHAAEEALDACRHREHELARLLAQHRLLMRHSARQKDENRRDRLRAARRRTRVGSDRRG